MILIPITARFRRNPLKNATTVVAALALIIGVAGCGSNDSSDSADTSSPTPIKVVAAENFWGSLAGQVGGQRIQQVSIITSPDTDPHDYEPTTQDSSTIAQSQIMILNGIGYDPWADKALDASPSASRRVINVGELLGLKEGDNPHRWYSPSDVAKVIDSITDNLKAIDSTNSGYFDAQKTDLVNNKLADYNRLKTEITQKYSGTEVGATESIFTPMAKDLGLNLITPDKFLNAINEGQAPTAADKITTDSQIEDKRIRVLVFNSQNSTPDVKALVNKATASGIPVVSVTETLIPTNAAFQDWQSAQLQALADALAKSTGK